MRGVLPGRRPATELPSSVDELDSRDGGPPPRLLSGRAPVRSQGAEVPANRGLRALPVVAGEIATRSGSEQGDEHQSGEIHSPGSDVRLLPVDQRSVTPVVEKVPRSGVPMGEDKPRGSGHHRRNKTLRARTHAIIHQAWPATQFAAMSDRPRQPGAAPLASGHRWSDPDDRCHLHRWMAARRRRRTARPGMAESGARPTLPPSSLVGLAHPACRRALNSPDGYVDCRPASRLRAAVRLERELLVESHLTQPAPLRPARHASYAEPESTGLSRGPERDQHATEEQNDADHRENGPARAGGRLRTASPAVVRAAPRMRKVSFCPSPGGPAQPGSQSA